MSDQRRLVGTGDVLTFLYTIPLVIIGLIWLIVATDLAIIEQNFLFLVFNFGLLFLFRRLSFFTIIEIRSDRYGSLEDSFASMIQWSAVFLLGPSALWVGVFYNMIDFLNNWRTTSNPAQRWYLLRTISVTIAISTFAFLISIAIYEFIGGSLPLGASSFS
jgi:hypothetical protein